MDNAPQLMSDEDALAPDPAPNARSVAPPKAGTSPPASTSALPAIPVPSASAAPFTLPDGMVLNMAAAQNVYPHGGGVFTDAAGRRYTPAAEHGPGYFTDDSGALFHITPTVDASPPAQGAEPQPAAQAAPVHLMSDEEANPDQAASHHPTKDNLPAQAASGLGESVAGTVDSVADFLAKHLNPVAALGDALEATNPIADLIRMAITGKAPATPIRPYNPMPQPGVVSAAAAPLLAPAPTTLPGQIARIGGEFAPGLLVGPGGDAGALAQIATRLGNFALPVAGSKVGQWGAEQLGADPETQSAVAALGGMLGGGLVHVLGEAGTRAANSSALKPILAQVGPKVEVAPGVMATRNAANQAADFLAARTTNLPAARSALAGFTPSDSGPPQTLGAVTGDRGLLANEHNVASTDPTGYKGTFATGGDPMDMSDHIRGIVSDLDSRLQADVEAARASADATTAAAKAKAEGLVTAEKDAAQTHLERTQAWGAATVQGVTEEAKDAAAALGGTGRPEEYGATIRGHIVKALADSNARESGLWKALEPYDSLTGNVTSTRLAARNVMANMTEDHLAMSPSERAIFDRVSQWPDTLPIKNVLGMRSQINAIAADEFGAHGNSPIYARLTALRNALGENLSTTLADNIERPGVAAKVQEWENANQSASEARSVAGGAREQPSAEGAPPVAATGGTALSEGGGSGSASGTQGVSAQVPNLTEAKGPSGQRVGWVDDQGKWYSDAQAKALGAQAPSAPQGPTVPPTPEAPATAIPSGTQPTITKDTLAEMQGATAAANAATKEEGQTFREGPVSPVIQTYRGTDGQPKMPNGLVPQQFFAPGPAGAEAMRALAKASPEAMPAIHDYAASTLQAMAPDGIITPKVLQRWQARYSEAISQMPPDMQAAFGVAAQKGQAVADTSAAVKGVVDAAAQVGKDAVKSATAKGDEITDEAAKIASKTVADAMAARKTAMDAATSGAIGKVIGTPPGDPVAVTRTVGRILASDTGVSDMRSLVATTKGNPAAALGLRQAVIDHVTNTLFSNADSGVAGAGKINNGAFQAFLKRSGPALSEVLRPDEMARLTAIGDSIAGPNAYETLTRGAVQGKPARIIADTLGSVIGSALGHITGLPIAGELVGGSAGLGTAEMLGHLRAAGVQSVADLVRAGTFDASVGRALLQRVKGPTDLSADSGPGRALLRALIAPTVAASATKPQPKTPSALEGVR